MDAMMYMFFKINMNAQYTNTDVVGFGKNDEEKCYVLFIKA
jgi:hypothetical protein